MIVVHHLNNSRSQRILWMLEELGVEYEVKRYERDSKTRLAPEALKKIHPLGKSPVITDGDITVAESGAIVEYLARNYGKGRMQGNGDDAAELRDYTYWMHYAEGSLMPFLVMTLIFNTIKTSPMPFFVRPIAKAIADKVLDSYVLPNTKSNMDFIEAHLEGRDWFVGDRMTGADVQLIFPLEAGMSRMDAQRYPNIARYVAAIHARPAYQKALEQGGPYDYA